MFNGMRLDNLELFVRSAMYHLNFFILLQMMNITCYNNIKCVYISTGNCSYLTSIYGVSSSKVYLHATKLEL